MSGSSLAPMTAPFVSARVAPDGAQCDAWPDQPLLVSLEQGGIDWPSSCRNGTCRTCLGQLRQGSVRYEIGLFEQGEAQSAASGHFVHVYVDRVTRRPTELPEAFVQALKALQVPASA